VFEIQKEDLIKKGVMIILVVLWGCTRLHVVVRVVVVGRRQEEEKASFSSSFSFLSIQ
jgi:hypothetical protein